MLRDFFRQAEVGSVGPSGAVISDIQLALNASGVPQIVVDGLFGGQTAHALADFQASKGFIETGTVTQETWSKLMHCAEPSIFDRCLQVTASFEGTGFTEVIGNFDGQGLTWGIIGFTLANGELGAVLAEVAGEYPDLLHSAFGGEVDEILYISGPETTKADKIAWGDSVSRGENRYHVAEPWKTYFREFGSLREVQKTQIRRARLKYWSRAIKDARALDMTDELDLLLLYDIAVQNGGMNSKGRLQAALAAINAQNPRLPIRRREIVAEVVSRTSRKKYQTDVLKRKLTIAAGKGTVHGGHYKLSDWGVLDGYQPDIGA